MYYLTAFSSVILLSAVFCLTKIYQNRCGSAPSAVIPFTMLGGFASSVFFFVFSLVSGGEPFGFTLFSFAAALLTVICFGSYTFLGFRIMSKSGVSLYTMFLMLGGMILPYLFGMIFLSGDEEASSILFPAVLPAALKLPSRIAGIILMTVSVVLTSTGNRKNEKGSKKTLLACVAVFFLNGAVSIVSKIHQLPSNAEKAVDTGSFVMMTSLVKFCLFFVLFAVLLTVAKKRKSTAPAVTAPLCDPRAVIVAVCAAFFDGFSYFLQLTGASHLPATVLYPLVTGGSIVITAVCGRLFFKEKRSVAGTAGVVLCFVSTFFFL